MRSSALLRVFWHRSPALAHRYRGMAGGICRWFCALSIPNSTAKTVHCSVRLIWQSKAVQTDMSTLAKLSHKRQNRLPCKDDTSRDTIVSLSALQCHQYRTGTAPVTYRDHPEALMCLRIRLFRGILGIRMKSLAEPTLKREETWCSYQKRGPSRCVQNPRAGGTGASPKKIVV